VAILSKAIYIFNAILIKILVKFIKDIEKPAIEIIWKQKRPGIAKAILS
jgi:hypothetical protein